MATIELKGIGHSYERDNYALKPLDIFWNSGEAIALLGPSGCGKTTLLNILSGLLKPSCGQILFDGREVNGLSPAARKVAQVFQFPVVYENMSVAENLAFPLRRSLSKKQRLKRVKEIAELLDINDLLPLKCKALPAHLKQIAALGRALVRKDLVAILFDEPLTIVDPQKKSYIRRKLKHIQRETNVTMVYVTHDQNEALTFAEQVYVMQQGELLQWGSPEEVFEFPQHPFVGTFLGSPGMNILEAQRLAGQIAACGRPLALDIGPNDLDGVKSIGIRPENLALEQKKGWEFLLDGEVREVEQQHLGKIVTIQSEGTQLKVFADSGAEHKIGKKCQVFYRREKVSIFSQGRPN